LCDAALIVDVANGPGPSEALCEEEFYTFEPFLLLTDPFLTFLPSLEAAAIATGFCCPFLDTEVDQENKCDPNSDAVIFNAAVICELISSVLALVEVYPCSA
jgi:hypothetical protein